MAIVLHSGVAAAGTVLMAMVGVGVAGHGQAPCEGRQSSPANAGILKHLAGPGQ
jgi:hypothetical protein